MVSEAFSLCHTGIESSKERIGPGSARLGSLQAGTEEEGRVNLDSKVGVGARGGSQCSINPEMPMVVSVAGNRAGAHLWRGQKTLGAWWDSVLSEQSWTMFRRALLHYSVLIAAISDCYTEFHLKAAFQHPIVLSEVAGLGLYRRAVGLFRELILSRGLVVGMTPHVPPTRRSTQSLL